MSVTREEDRQKNGCPNRGLGIAAAALGVGVGAALYYFFNKRAEQPSMEGSTSDWNCDRTQALHDDEYTTISEHETTDTSINDMNSPLYEEEYDSDLANSMSDSDNIDYEDQVSSDLTNDSDIEITHHGVSISIDSLSNASALLRMTNHEDSHNDSCNTTISDSDDIYGVEYVTSTSSPSSPPAYSSSPSSSSSSLDNDYSVITELDVPSSPLRVPQTVQRISSRMPANFSRLWSSSSHTMPRMYTEAHQRAMRRQEQFRERSWTLEQCSICFDMMLRDQEVMRLPCAHNFHTKCILPWLQEKQTCPNCREVAE